MIAVSRSEADLVTRLGACPADRLHVVPNGITLAPPPASSRDLRAELGLEADAPLVGWVGRLAPQKAPEVLVAATAALPPSVHTVLLGGGPDLEVVRDVIRQQGVAGRVHLLGHVAGAAGLLDQLDVLALPSRWEGAPYVPLEAFRAGTPVVATDVVGTRDVVRDGETGWLVPADDADALARALATVLGDPAEAARRASLAHASLVAHHDVREMGRATTAVYRHLASSSSSDR